MRGILPKKFLPSITVLIILQWDKWHVEAGGAPMGKPINCKPTTYEIRAHQDDDVTFYEWAEVVLAKNENITPYITHILHSRLDQVLTGKRQKIFSKYYKQSLDCIDGKYPRIVSTHGRSATREIANGGSDNEITNVVDYEGPVVNVKNPDNVFPDEISSLDLSLTPSTYALASKEIEKRVKLDSLDEHDKYSKEIMFLPKLALRAIKLGFNFAPVSMTFGLAAVSKTFREKIWFSMVARCLAKSGPAFIKWGQWASTRSDMFPDNFCVALSALHADAPAHSWRFTKYSVEEALCIPPGTLFDVFGSFDRDPIASGSIAQIHKATLKPLQYGDKAGPVVAVKVRHPDVARLIDIDFRLMGILAEIVDCVPGLSWLRVKDSVEQFSHTMAAQAHLNVEGHHLEVLNHNFRKWKDVGFPQPIFACSKVIIETFETGEICTTLLDKYDNMAEREGNGRGDENIPVPMAKFIVTTGLGLYLKMLLVDNLMHADLHPGNIMVWANMVQTHLTGDDDEKINRANNGVKLIHPVGGGNAQDVIISNTKRSSRNKSKDFAAQFAQIFLGHITLVDAGMVAKLNDDESLNFVGLMSSLGAGDGRTAAEAVLQFSDDNGLSREEEEAFINDMVILFKQKCRGYGTDVDVGEVLRGVLVTIKKHHVRIDANYATLVINALCIEGLAKRVCPSYNVLDSAKPLLSSHRALTLRGNNDSKFKTSIIRRFTPILYFRKNAIDNAFFRRLEAKRRREKRERSCKIIPIVGSFLAAAATAYSCEIIRPDIVHDTGKKVLRSVVDNIPRRVSLDDGCGQ